MSGEPILLTIHKGCDTYTSCALCGGDLYLKRSQPALYSAQPDKLAWVCRECAEREDTETAALFELLDRLTTHPRCGSPECGAPVSIVAVVTADGLRLFSTGERADVADLAAKYLCTDGAAGWALHYAAEAVMPDPPRGLIAKAQALAECSELTVCTGASGEPLSCVRECSSCLTLRNLAEMSECKCGSADPYPLTDARTPLPAEGRWW